VLRSAERACHTHSRSLPVQLCSCRLSPRFICRLLQCSPSSPCLRPNSLQSPRVGSRPGRAESMAVDPRQVVAGFLTLSMFVMLGNMIKHDHFSPVTEVYFFPFPTLAFLSWVWWPLVGSLFLELRLIWWRVANLCAPRISRSFRRIRVVWATGFRWRGIDSVVGL
jgi:hypothetical protein